MKKLFVFVFLLLASSSVYALDQVEKAKQSDDIVIIETNLGEIQLGLFRDEAPVNVENIVKLVEKGFYDGTTFHRVIPGFVIQGGDPNSKDDDPSNDGYGGPGYYVKDEISKDLKHLEGTVALAKAADDQNGSQFYICLGRLNSLDGKYTIVGQVIKGMDVAQKIAQVKTDKNDRPIENVKMKKVSMKEAGADKAETADTLEAEDTTAAADTTEAEEPEVVENPSGGGCGCGRSKK
jgi:cyclophilin family peptidyl-prolyl cis-trans isomerase